MNHYRFYLLVDVSGRIHSTRDIDAFSDEAAIEIATGLTTDKSIEIWCGTRKVHRLESPATAILERHRAHKAQCEFAAAGEVLRVRSLE